jgi:predicted dehydrogenase
VNDRSARRLRHAVIGAGAGVLKAHMPALLLPSVDLVAVTDTDEASERSRAAELGCAFYGDHLDMLADEAPEVCVILAPQPFHARIAIDCLEAGSHVLVEKPMAVRLDEADTMVEVAEATGQLLAVNFQRRFRPEVRAAKRLIKGGELGDVQRISTTHYWTRPAAYYQTTPWRALPAIEGGGLLMNQASHDLDLLCHLLGMPERVVAWTDTILHDVEVEDTVQAMLRWRGGVFGSLYTSTAGAGDEPNLVVYGTAGCGSSRVGLSSRGLGWILRSTLPWSQIPSGRLRIRSRCRWSWRQSRRSSARLPGPSRSHPEGFTAHGGRH